MHTSFLKISLTLAVSVMTFSTLCFANEANNTEDPIACTMEYRPVCGEIQVQCIQAPCLPVRQTFGNMCMAQASHASNITEGECIEPNEPIAITTIITRAYQAGITKYDNEKDFMGNTYLTREQTAKMLMTTTEKMGASEWMLKQASGSCEWLDTASITPDLLDRATRSCMKGLFKGGNKYFMPHNLVTHAEMTIVFERLATFVPSLKTTLTRLITTHRENFFTRNDFVRILYTMTHNFNNHKYSQYQKDLDHARILWSEKGNDTYSLTQQMTCFCMRDYTRPIIYTVIHDSIQTGTVLYADDNTALASGMTIELHTVGGAFDIIQNAIDDRAASLTVSYDESTGYPKNIAIDYDTMIADEETYYSFTVGTGS